MIRGARIGVAAGIAVREERQGDHVGIVGSVGGGEQAFGGLHRVVTGAGDDQRQNQAVRGRTYECPAIVRSCCGTTRPTVRADLL